MMDGRLPDLPKWGISNATKKDNKRKWEVTESIGLQQKNQKNRRKHLERFERMVQNDNRWWDMLINGNYTSLNRRF